MERKELRRKGYTLYLEKEIIKLLEDEKYETRKSPSFIVNELLKKRYNKKGEKKE